MNAKKIIIILNIILITVMVIHIVIRMCFIYVWDPETSFSRFSQILIAVYYLPYIFGINIIYLIYWIIKKLWKKWKKK